MKREPETLIKKLAYFALVCVLFLVVMVIGHNRDNISIVLGACFATMPIFLFIFCGMIASGILKHEKLKERYKKSSEKLARYTCTITLIIWSYQFLTEKITLLGFIATFAKIALVGAFINNIELTNQLLGEIEFTDKKLIIILRYFQFDVKEKEESKPEKSNN